MQQVDVPASSLAKGSTPLEPAAFEFNQTGKNEKSVSCACVKGNETPGSFTLAGSAAIELSIIP
jgi:hypothetical protein